MDAELEEMVEMYKRLIEKPDMSPNERVLLAKRRRDMWWEIRQRIKAFPNAMRMKVYRSAHPEKALEQWIRQRDKNRRLKVEVLTHYGNGKCACVRCGEQRISCLSIDHIDGRGNRHRGTALRSSSAFYGWLKERGFPTGFQTLCMNDQFVKRFENNEEGKYATRPIEW